MTSNISDLVKAIEELRNHPDFLENAIGAGTTLHILLTAIADGTLTPADKPERVFEVKEGYCLQAYIDNSVHEPVEWVDPPKALTIRSAEDVRRETIEEAALKVEAVTGRGNWVAEEIRALIDTPAQSNCGTCGEPIRPDVMTGTACACSTKTKSSPEPVCCDCARPYYDEWSDLTIPNDEWQKISPDGEGNGLLCASCMCARAHRAGIECETVFRSGPFCVADKPMSVVEALFADAYAEAEKAIRKFPQPNYVISKVAEEAGEVVKAAIHCAEGRETPENVVAEIKQAIAMLIRLYLEGDQVHGLRALAAQGGE